MSQPASPDTNLANLVIALLTPMFLWATEGDIPLARIAAAQTLNEFRIANRLSLFTVAKVIAFDIATLSSLSLSMYEDVTMLLALRLRSNATGLDRAAERNRRAFELEQASRADASEQAADSVEAAVAEAQRMVQEAKARVQEAAQAAAPVVVVAAPVAEPVAPAAEAVAAEDAPAPVPPAARSAAQQRHAAWAAAMTVVAEECAAGLQDLPPAERRKEMARIEALGIAAADLASGTAAPAFPGMAAE